jgi:pimeloyl-ACP methyl ester carboxylesterase
MAAARWFRVPMDLACDDFGLGTPVVCLPPFSLDRSVMAAALEPVLARRADLRRIYVDLPGHGESPAGEPTSEYVAGAVSSFLDAHLGGAPRLLAGWSYGGYIAAALARRQPAAVAGLLLICAGVKTRPQDRDLPAAPAEPGPEGWLDEIPEGLRAHLATAIGNRTAPVAARVAAVMATSRPGDEEYRRRLQAGGYQFPDEGHAARYPGPTCVITGRHDRVVGFADQFRSLPAYPKASFTVVADAGHYLPLEQPAAFRKAADTWLDRCAAELAHRDTRA